MSEKPPCKWFAPLSGCDKWGDMEVDKCEHPLSLHLSAGDVRGVDADCHGCPCHEPAEPAKPETCEWIQDWEGNWTGTCGVYWITDDVGSMKHCPNCGRTVTATPYTEPKEGDDAVATD